MRPARAAVRRRGIQLDVAGAQGHRSRRPGPAPERPQPRHELGEGKGLGHVVVGAEREAVDEIVGPRRGGEHQHSAVGLLVAQRAADLVAVQLGQVAVEHDHVVGVQPRLVQGGGAVVGHVDRHALAAQSAGQGVGDPAFVLGKQHAHRIQGSERPPTLRYPPVTGAFVVWPHEREPQRRGPAGGARERALRDQASDHRPGRDARARDGGAAHRRPRAAGGSAGPGQDPDHQDAGLRGGRQLQPHPVHARPGPLRSRGHAHLPPGQRQLRRRARPGVRQLPPRRRDQPRAGQGPVGPARGDAGAAGHDRRPDARGAPPLPGARHPEPDRVRGHLPAARGAGRPLPDEDPGRLPVARRRGHGRRSLADGGGDGRGAHRRGRPAALSRRRGRGDGRPRGDRLRGRAGRRHAPARPLRPGRGRAADQLRSLAARTDRPRAGRALAGAAARPAPRVGRRRDRPRARGAPPPAGAELRGAERGRAAGRPAREGAGGRARARSPRRGGVGAEARRRRDASRWHRPPGARAPGRCRGRSWKRWISPSCAAPEA